MGFKMPKNSGFTMPSAKGSGLYTMPGMNTKTPRQTGQRRRSKGSKKIILTMKGKKFVIQQKKTKRSMTSYGGYGGADIMSPSMKNSMKSAMSLDLDLSMGGGKKGRGGLGDVGMPDLAESGFNTDISNMKASREFNYLTPNKMWGARTEKYRTKDKNLKVGRDEYVTGITTPLGDYQQELIPVSDEFGNPLKDAKGNTVFERSSRKTGALNLIGKGISGLQTRIKESSRKAETLETRENIENSRENKPNQKYCFDVTDRTRDSTRRKCYSSRELAISAMQDQRAKGNEVTNFFAEY